MRALTVLALVAASYLIYTLAATGLAKVQVYGPVMVRSQRLGPAAFRTLGWVAVGFGEIGAVAAAIVQPGSSWPPLLAGVLFTGFLMVNLTAWLRGRNEAPCRCAGVEQSGARAGERAVANGLCLTLVGLWVATAPSFPPPTRAVFLSAALALLVHAALTRAAALRRASSPEHAPAEAGPSPRLRGGPSTS